MVQYTAILNALLEEMTVPVKPSMLKLEVTTALVEIGSYDSFSEAGHVGLGSDNSCSEAGYIEIGCDNSSSEARRVEIGK